MKPGKKILITSLALVMFLLLDIHFSNAQINPLNLYLTKNDINLIDSIAYPCVGMGLGATYGTDDWTYDTPQFDFFAIPNGNQSLYAAEMIVTYDTSKITLSALPGNLFNLYYFDTITTSPGIFKINIASLNGNVLPALNKYIVKIKATATKPGFSRIVISNSDFRYFDDITNTQLKIPLTLHNCEVKFYPGDFATSRTVLDKGDGNINFNDIAIFFQHYGGILGDGIYKRKYDISSDMGQNYFDMPLPDGDLDFWDLIILGTGYAKEGSGQLLSKSNSENKIIVNNNFIFCSTGNFIKEGNKIKVPVNISGDLSEIHGLSIGVTYNPKIYDFSGFSNGSIFNEKNSLSATRVNGSTVFFDAVTISSLNFPSNSNGLNLCFMEFNEKFPVSGRDVEIGLVSCIGVNINNKIVKTEFKNGIK